MTGEEIRQAIEAVLDGGRLGEGHPVDDRSALFCGALRAVLVECRRCHGTKIDPRVVLTTIAAALGVSVPDGPVAEPSVAHDGPAGDGTGTAKVRVWRQFKDRDERGTWYEVAPDRLLYAYSEDGARRMLAVEPGAVLPREQVDARFGPLVEVGTGGRQ